MLCTNLKICIKYVSNLISRNLTTQPARRAILYVPGDSEKHTEKALTLPLIDCVVFDCEDGVGKKKRLVSPSKKYPGVAHNNKDKARNSIKNIFRTKIPCSKNNYTDFAVRVNSVKSGLLADDLKVIFGGNDKSINPKTIFLPKVNNIKDIEEFFNLLSISLENLKCEPINLIFYSESCESLLNLKEICQKGKDLNKNETCFVLAGVAFGSDDFLADLGATRDPANSSNILYARQKIVLTAKAFGLQAIDMVYINFKDTEGLRVQCLEGVNMGYTGKQTIHPLQVKIVQDAFMPSVEKIEWARECLKAYKQNQELGKGAFVFRNQMIDNPTVEQAINILKLAELSDNTKS